MDKRGKFIVIDGMDGSGKGTQINLLKEKLQGKPAAFTREPGGTPRADLIRDVLLGKDGPPSNPLCDFFVFYGARASHVLDFVEPTRQAATHVICDRYDSSTFAFQLTAEGRDTRLFDLFCETRQILGSAFYPDLYIFLELPPEVAFERRAKDTGQEKSRFDLKPLEYHRKVQDGFREFAERFGRAKFVDANRAPADIHADLWQLVSFELGIQ